MTTKPTLRMVGKMRDLLYLNSCVTITDNTQVLLENCKKIMECTEILVRVQTAEYEIEVWGTGLTMDNYSAASVVVRGTIQNVSIMARRRH
ncbi:MAG: YabP/YqfC family sporulation protein [Oscillospiraceae bacterium]